jgi:hypothetical protein
MPSIETGGLAGAGGAFMWGLGVNRRFSDGGVSGGGFLGFSFGGGLAGAAADMFAIGVKGRGDFGLVSIAGRINFFGGKLGGPCRAGGRAGVAAERFSKGVSGRGDVGGVKGCCCFCSWLWRAGRRGPGLMGIVRGPRGGGGSFPIISRGGGRGGAFG